MLFVKATEGVVLQLFNDAGECVGQKFIAGDVVSYETYNCDEINVTDMPKGGNEYYPFVMEQPENQPEIAKEWVG